MPQPIARKFICPQKKLRGKNQLTKRSARIFAMLRTTDNSDYVSRHMLSFISHMCEEAKVIIDSKRKHITYAS